MHVCVIYQRKESQQVALWEESEPEEAAKSCRPYSAEKHGVTPFSRMLVTYRSYLKIATELHDVDLTEFKSLSN